MAGWTFANALPQAKQSEVLEQQYDKEANPRKRADIAKKLTAHRLSELRARVTTGDMLDPSTPELKSYEAAVDRLGDSVREASHTGTTKGAEQYLRDQMHALDNLKMNVSASERPYLERIVARVDSLREEMLNTLMYPKESVKAKDESPGK
jgi:hypothetical protein